MVPKYLIQPIGALVVLGGAWSTPLIPDYASRGIHGFDPQGDVVSCVADGCLE